MDQEKIGSFIALLRKEKKLTQQELADLLHVTDRAVSHWENGRRLPDVSLFEKICEIFDISVNELLNGERYTKNSSVKEYDNNIINTLKNNKKFKFITIILIILLLISLITIIILSNKYPKIKIFHFDSEIESIDDEFKLTKTIIKGNQNIYYYEIDKLKLCDIKERCYELNSAIDHNQIDFNKIKDYLIKQGELGNVEVNELNDGGTILFEGSNYSFIFCNTIIDNNQDIYIGTKEMIKKLDGNYCTHVNNIKRFIRTYHIKEVKESKNATIDVTLTSDYKKYYTVNILNLNKVIPGHTYEFIFTAFDYFDDTIENIFKYADIYNISEVFKDEKDYINEDIIVNINNKSELNDLKNAFMTIKKDTLTKTNATIIIDDYSNNMYSYGDYYRIEKYQNNGEWKELEEIIDNVGFNDMAYLPDKVGKLKFDLNWEKRYGELDSGRYRIVKYALSNNDDCFNGMCNKYYISVEFRI